MGKAVGAILLTIASAVYFWFLFIFFKRLRPRLSAWLGSKLGVTIVEDGEGTWEVAEKGHLAKGFLVGLVDISACIGASCGPILVLGSIALLFFR